VPGQPGLRDPSAPVELPSDRDEGVAAAFEAQPFEVTIARTGPGRAVIRHDSPVCTRQDVLRLDFAVRGHSVEVRRATPTGECMVPVEDAAGLAGTTVRVRPLP
jgi:hypothetical protein